MIATTHPTFDSEEKRRGSRSPKSYSVAEAGYSSIRQRPPQAKPIREDTLCTEKLECAILPGRTEAAITAVLPIAARKNYRNNYSVSDEHLSRNSFLRMTFGKRNFCLPGPFLPLAVLLLSAIWVFVSGKDLNWDALNYHLYGPHSLIEDRVQQDFFAASIQGYLNPIGYLPFYLTVRMGLHSLLIALVLTFIHATNVFFIYRLSKSLCGEGKFTSRYVSLSVALAFSTSIYWSLVGSSFIDLIVTIPMLAALCLLVGPAVGRKAFIAGVYMGAAVGLKLSCAIFAAPAVVLLLNDRIQGAIAPRVIRYALGGLLGFILLHGYWSYRLWTEFGNPFFPFFNAIFQSGDFPPENIDIQRYVPGTLQEYLLFPAQMALPAYWIYTELISPDLKPLVAWCLILSLWSATTYRRIRYGASGPESDGGQLLRLSLFWGFSYVGWSLTSAAGRYGLLLLFLSGPVIVASLHKLWRRRAMVVGTVVLIIQLGMLWVAGLPRWGEGVGWSRAWYDFEIPQPLKDKPALYLAAGKNSMSFLAVDLHPQSALVNVSGQYSLGLDTPGGNRIAALLSQYDSVRSLIPYEIDYKSAMEQESISAPSVYDEYQNAVYSRFGYQVTDECVFIRQRSQLDSAKTMLSCRLEPSESALRHYRADKTIIEKVFSTVEVACPRLLRPTGGPPEKMPFGWQKFYLNTDTRLKIVGDSVQLQRARTGNPFHVGLVGNVVSAGTLIDLPDCR